MFLHFIATYNMFHLLLCIPDEHGVHSSCCGDHQERPIAHLPEPKTWRGVGDGGGGVQ